MKKAVYFKSFILLFAHILFWISVYFFYTYFLGYGSSNTEYVNQFSVYLMPATIVTSYVFFLFLIPNYLLKGKKNLFLLYSFYTFVISFFLVILSIFYASVFLAHLKENSIPALTKTLPYIILGVYFIVIIVIVIGLIIHNQKSIIKNEELKTKFLQAELQLKEQKLNFLKMQIHPHFLFNSLNTIYGYTLKKADEAPEMVLKLSNLLDYILYQVDKPKVNLHDEINHLKDYIELEKMRFHDTLHIIFNNNTKKTNLQIAPMLFIPFAENSFKHGTILNGQLFVKISISLLNNKLLFSIENSIKTETNLANGIGLKNIKKRLHLLYPDAHSLEIEEKNDTFKVNLKIEPNKLKTVKNEP